jgi:hypothetical protein
LTSASFAGIRFEMVIRFSRNHPFRLEEPAGIVGAGEGAGTGDLVGMLEGDRVWKR